MCAAVAVAACAGSKDGPSTSRVQVAATLQPATLRCRVDSTGVAGLRLGATVADSRSALPGARLERTTDGDGAALVAVKVDTADVAVLYAGEDDAAAPLDLSRPVQVIETFHPDCRTADGIHPGSLVLDVERVLGKTTEIVVSEIESRQFITFERMPPRTTFRLDYSGEFAEGERRTTRYRPGARILSIAVSR
jgi:hypothetical protein